MERHIINLPSIPFSYAERTLQVMEALHAAFNVVGGQMIPETSIGTMTVGVEGLGLEEVEKVLKSQGLEFNIITST